MTTLTGAAGIPRRRLLRRAMALVAAFALAAAQLLATGTAHPVAAVWTPTDLTRNPYLSRPHLVVDGANTNSVIYERQGDDPGVIVTTGSGSTWTDTRLDSGLDYGAVIALDAGGKRHVAFARAGVSPGIYYTTDATGSWSAPLRVTTDVDGVPSIAVDAAGHVHIAYISFGFSPGLYYATNATGTWVKLRLFAASVDYWPSIGLDSTGHVHIAWVRFAPEAPGLYYVTNATGAWVATRLTTYFANAPALIIDASDQVRIAFVRWQSTWSALYVITNQIGWTEQQLWDDPAYDIGAPTIAIDQSSTYVVAPRWPKNPANSGAGLTIFYGGGTMLHLPNDPAETDDDMPSMAFDTTAHRLHLAFQRTLPTPGIAYYEAANFDPATALNSLTLAGSVLDSAPSLAMDGTFKQHLAFERDSTDSDNGIETATDATGSWVYEHAVGTPATPAEAVDGSGHDHIAYSDGTNVHHATNATGSWVDEVVVPGRDPAIALDASGHVFIAYFNSYYIGVARNDMGPWGSDCCFVVPGSGRPSIAVDALTHVRLLFADGGPLMLYTGVLGEYTGVQIAPAGDSPSMAIDPAGKTHITYRRSGAAAGTYYVTNKTGSWVTTRLTRTSAETAPSLAIDPAGHVFIAMARYYWAANPGIFIVSNRTGPWVTTQLTTQEGDVDPTIGVDGSGRARIVYDNEGLGLTDLVEADPLSLTPSPRPTAAWQRAMTDLFEHNDRGGLLGLLQVAGGTPGARPTPPDSHGPSTGAMPGGAATDSGASGLSQR